MSQTRPAASSGTPLGAMSRHGEEMRGSLTTLSQGRMRSPNNHNFNLHNHCDEDQKPEVYVSPRGALLLLTQQKKTSLAPIRTE